MPCPLRAGAGSRSLIGLLLAVVFAACASPAETTRPDSGAAQAAIGTKRIVAAVAGDPPSLYPDLNPAGGVRGVESLTAMVNDGLSIIDEHGALEARAAEAVPTLENGLWKLLPDGRMETTWHIRSSARWHDGTPLTSADLLFTAMIGQDKEVAVFGNIAYDTIEQVSAPDAQTVTVTWKAPYIYADGAFTREFALPMPKHILQPAYDDNKAGIADHPYFSTEYVGTGPYKLRELVHGSGMVLDATEAYFLGRPKIDVIEVRFILDSNTLAANLQAGSVDLALGRAFSLEQALAVKEQWTGGRLDIAPSNAIQIHPQLLDPTPAVVSDVRFRRAVIQGIDRQGLIDAFFAGQTTVADAWINANDEYYNELAPSVVRYTFDPRQSSLMLEELGYTKGPDEMYRDRVGEPLKLEIRTSTPNQSQIQALYAIGDMLQRVGIAVDSVVVPLQRAQELPYRSNFPAFEMVRGMSDLRSLNTFHSRAARVPENGYRGSGGTNYARYMSPELDQLVERYYATIPIKDRLQVAGQILHLTSDQLVVMPVVWDVEPTLLSSRLVNVKARNRDSSNGWNVYQWDVAP